MTSNDVVILLVSLELAGLVVGLVILLLVLGGVRRLLKQNGELIELYRVAIEYIQTKPPH